MSKPIKFELEFSGYANLRVDGDGDYHRPMTADEMAAQLHIHLSHLFRQCDRKAKMRVNIKRVR